MEKIYIAPEFEVLKCEFVEDVIMASTEPSIPIQTDEPELPTGDPIPDF
ncbi:MAG: hypothetical protein IJT79_03415 [Ruminococcus sp.]|nr:hypothetical protein [Ruminococcus sp.]